MIAQLTSEAIAAERLDRAYARIERRMDRSPYLMSALDMDPVAVSPGQLRLVIGE